MTPNHPTPVTILGLGAMGSAIARVLLEAGHPVTVWNRTTHKSDDVAASGAAPATTVDDAVAASQLVITCLFDDASVRDVLDPVAGAMSGRVLVNVTTGSPAQAREMAAWAHGHGITYLDGGMMAVPDMIGRPGASIFYSGSHEAFERYRNVLDVVAESRYFGADAGAAALHDLALLAAMYAMLAGFYHGAAMVATAGVSAKEFAAMAGPWLRAMTASFDHDAGFIDSGDYTTDAQSLEFNKSALDLIVAASRDHGVATDVVAPIHQLIARQVATGHGLESVTRIYTDIAST